MAAGAANRFGLGARPGDLAAIGADPPGWLRAQVGGGAPLVADSGLQSSRQVLAEAAELRREKRAEKDASPNAGPAADPAARPAVKLARQFRSIYLDEARARLRAAVSSDRPFVERLVHFWSNHFAVSADKPVVTGVAGAFEREAIRPNVLGNFATLLQAVEQHPAMLMYLDNQASIGPDSRAATFMARRRQPGASGPRRAGINENLAREMLELHTLGVDGGYTQADVTTFAKVLTGWSVDKSGGFVFREASHEPGAQTLLGRRYAEAGLAQGEAVLVDLARHPATARHIARKLAAHFVADDPPPALVDRLARVFRDSGGDLPAVYRALVDNDLAWQQSDGKFKTPSDYIVSACRALSLPVDEGPRSIAAFVLLGQRPWMPGSPAGWPDRTADWSGSAAVFKRVEWAGAVAARLGSRRQAATLAPDVLGDRLSAHTRGAIAGADSATQALTLLLASPEFMWRPA